MNDNEEEFTLEELLEIVGGPSKAPDKSSSPPPRKVELHRTVFDFLASKGVTDGYVRVPFFRIAAAYFAWCAWGRHKAVSPIQFGRELKKAGFTQKRSGKEGRVYLLNECFDMSEEKMERARYYYNVKHKQMRRTRWSKKVRQSPKVGRSLDVPR